MQQASAEQRFNLHTFWTGVDFYKKIPADLTEATTAGAAISIVAAVVIVLLIGSVSQTPRGLVQQPCWPACRPRRPHALALSALYATSTAFPLELPSAAAANLLQPGSCRALPLLRAWREPALLQPPPCSAAAPSRALHPAGGRPLCSQELNGYMHADLVSNMVVDRSPQG